MDECYKEDSCVSTSISSTSVSSKSSDWKHIYREILKEVDLAKKDAEAAAQAAREIEAGSSEIPSEQVNTLWMKVKETKIMSMIKGTVVVYSSESYLLLYDLVDKKRSVFCPHPVEKNNGVGFHVGHHSLDVLAVAEVSTKPCVFIVQYPSMEITNTVSDNSEGRYDSLAFSGERMLVTLKSALKLFISFWDWRTKTRYFNIERDSYSQSLSLRGSSDACQFSLLCMGMPSKLFLWEMSIFTDIVSLFSKHCTEDKPLDLKDQCLFNGNVFAVDVNGDVYKANKESSDHLKFVRIIEYTEDGQASSAEEQCGPYITGIAPATLAVYGPAKSIKYYKKQLNSWVVEKTTQLDNALYHLVSPPNENFLIGWDKNGLIKIGQETEELEDKRIMTEHVTSIAIVHPEDIVVATLLIKRKILFWTIDQGFYISQYEFTEEVEGMLCHMMVPYLVVRTVYAGDIHVIDVQNIRRPRLHKIISVTFEPLACMEFNPKGNFLVASGTGNGSIFLIEADPSKNFAVDSCAITKTSFSSFATIMGSTGHEWVVLLLSSFRNTTNRYCELLAVPRLTEFIKVDLGRNFALVQTCYTKPSSLIALIPQDILVFRITIDTKNGKLSDEEVVGRSHIVPPVSVSQDIFHSVTYGGRDGYMILYSKSGPVLTLAPHRFSGIRWAAFASRSRSFITLTRDMSLVCFSLLAPCGHSDVEHIFSILPYKYLPYSKAKMFKRVSKDEIPWDEKEDNQKKIRIYKTGLVRTIGHGMNSQHLMRILNGSDREAKIKLIKEAGGHYDHDVIIEYIRKWIDHYRYIAKKFVEYNEYLEAERPQEMIPWETIREVESRAYAEYRNKYEQTLSEFKEKVESSIERWTVAYRRIVEDTWHQMEKQPSCVKMIFRDFAVQDFGFMKGHEELLIMLKRRIGIAYMDCYLHQASENYIWDARFEVFENYWDQYFSYLKEAFELIQEDSKETIEEVKSDEGDEYLVKDLSQFLEDDLDPNTSNIFKKRIFENTLQSYTSMQRLGNIKRAIDVASSIMIGRSKEFSHATELKSLDQDQQRETRESDESLFYDPEEEKLANKPRALKRYKKRKRRILRKLDFEYPFIDEVEPDLFKDLFKLPKDFPEDCMFVRPTINISSVSDLDIAMPPKDQKHASEPEMVDSFLNVSEEDKEGDEDDVVSGMPDEASSDVEVRSLEKQSQTEDPQEEEPQINDVTEMEELLLQPASQKMVIAKQISDADYDAEMAELAKQAQQQKRFKKGKKEVTAVQIESTDEEIDEEDELPETLTIDQKNKLKRAVNKKDDKLTDKINVLTINEERVKKISRRPQDHLIKLDLSRLYLILDVDVLIETNRKRRKRRKSSLDREAMNRHKLKEAESTNERLTRLMTLAKVSEVRPGQSDRDSEESEDVIDLGKAKAFIHGCPGGDEQVETRRKVLLVGDIKRLKKRRWILGVIRDRSPEEILQSNLVKLGIKGETLPFNYVAVKRRAIVDRLKERNVDEEMPQEEQDEEQEENEEDTDLNHLRWLESAIAMFEAAKAKKIETVEQPEEEEQSSSDLLDNTSLLDKTKSTALLAMKSTTEAMEAAARENIEKEETKKEKPMLRATDNIETVEDGIAYLMVGTAAVNYIPMGPLSSRSQLTVPTTLNMISELALETNAIYDIYTYFNSHFDTLKKVKDIIMETIKSRQEKYEFYINEIRLACKENPEFPVMPPAVYSPKENPEMMIIVTDDEVPVSRYYSPSELSLIRRQEEEEALRRRKPKPDPFRLEALQIMMDGVVERRWEDELKKEIPFPKALKDKAPEEWDENEIALNLKYEEDVRFHNSERQRYKQILHQNIDQEIQAIRELHLGFDLRVKQMSDKVAEFIQIAKELTMFILRRFKRKAMQIAFLKAVEHARAFTEATKASMDQIESLVKALAKKLKIHKVRMSSIKKKKEQREEKLEETLKKMGVISADRAFVISNYIRPSFLINPKFLEMPNLLPVVLDCFDDSDNQASTLPPTLVEFFKEIANSLKRNVPQKLTKQIWEFLAQTRKENIKNDIEIAILQLDYNKADDAAKFFKSYLKQKQSFTEMIYKALESSLQRYKTAQFLQEYQVVLPMGMVEIEVGWEQHATMPGQSDLIIMPGEDYERLLIDKNEAETALASQKWNNEVTLSRISLLNTRHYDLIARNKLLSLNIKHIERYQSSMHSRSLIKEIKESGLRLGVEKITKRPTRTQSVAGGRRSRLSAEDEGDDVSDLQQPLETGTHFILSDLQPHEEEYYMSPDEEYGRAILEEIPKHEFTSKRIGRTISKNDLRNESSIQYLFDPEFDFSESELELATGGSKTSVYSTASKISKYSKISKISKISRISASSKISKMSKGGVRTIDKRDELGEEEERIPEEKKSTLRRTKKWDSFELGATLMKKSFPTMRAVLLKMYRKRISQEHKISSRNFMDDIEEMIRVYTWKGTQAPNLNIVSGISKINIEEDEIHKGTSEFELVKEKYIREAKTSIQRNNEIWYPKLSESDAELFKKDTVIDFDKYLEIPQEIQEVYDYDEIKILANRTESAPETTHQRVEEASTEYLERKKREFTFTGSWPERLVALWKELEGADLASKQLEKLIRKSKKPSSTDYWNYSDFNFKRTMKNNLLSLLKSYKNQVERQWKDSKSMEREMTRYIEMNKKCVLLFFNYELEQGKSKDAGAAMAQMTSKINEFSNKRNIKVEKAMKKAQLLREIQKNQYEILQLQSELELLQLRTYPILMYKYV